MKNDIRYYISKYSIYTFIFCCLFLFQRGVLLHLFDLKQYIIYNKIYVYEIILAILSYIEVKNFIKISPLD